MTRDQIIEKVARAMCRAAEGRRRDCMYTGYMSIARVAIATLESIGYHFADVGKMVAPSADTTPASEKVS